MRLALTAFTARGLALAEGLAAALEAQGEDCVCAAPARLAQGTGLSAYGSLSAWTGERFADCGALIFVGASGIAVRAIAPWVRDKFTDPAVVSVDEGGRFAVPLLSGHAGGANALARRLAALTGGTAAVSTATDVNGLFAVDEWAVRQGFYLDGRSAAKHISAALLAGESVGMESDFPIQGELPPGVHAGPDRLGFCVTAEAEKAPFDETLRLIPPVLTLGIGCRRGTEAGAIADAVDGVLAAHGLSPRGVCRVCSIDLKQDEPGLLEFCSRRGWSLACFSASALAGAEGAFTPSVFVARTTGVDNVCERAAVLGSGGALRVKKTAGGGVTVAVATAPFTVKFEGD